MKFKSLFTCYEFAAWLICLTKILGEGDLILYLRRKVLCQRVTQVDRKARATTERWVRSSRMPHVGYADSIMNDGPRFHLDIFDKSSPNPSLKPSRYVLGSWVTHVDQMAWAATERRVRSSRMPHVGYADSVMNDGPRFHSNISSKSSLNPSLYSSFLIHPSIAYAIIT